MTVLNKLTFATLGIITGVLVAELAVRFSGLSPAVFRLGKKKESAYEISSNPLLGYVLKANYRNPKADCHNTFPRTNSFGFRDKERQIEKKPNFKRIILLGDSVVAGHGLCRDQDTITTQLEELVSEQEIEILNFGTGGYCTLGEAALLQERGLQFAPDKVVLLFVENDYVNSNGAIVDARRWIRPAYQEQLFLNSALFRLAALRLNFSHFAEEADPLARLRAHRQDIGDDNVRRGLDLLKQLSLQNNFSVELALWPYFTDRAIEQPERHLSAATSERLLVENLAAERGIRTTRLSPIFEKDFEYRKQHPVNGKTSPSPRWMYTIGDGVHPSAYGARLAAQALKELVILR